jgi:hypothetical protein
LLRKAEKLILVGDNPFHGISHLTEDRARARGSKISQAECAAEIVLESIKNGANGFMFSVSDTTLSTLRIICEKINDQSIELHAIVPYAYEYVRLATHLGTLGLGKKLAGQILVSGNLSAVASGISGIVRMDPEDLMKTYLKYEESRIISSIGKKQKLSSILLHEVVTDMAVALNLDWLIKSYIHFVSRLGIKPGFETRNFTYLVNKFSDWDVDFAEIELVSSFNKVGFQMNPSQISCEQALARIPECKVIAMSILAAGYIRLPDAVEYIESLPNLDGMVVGVSTVDQALETFNFLKKGFQNRNNLDSKTMLG